MPQIDLVTYSEIVGYLYIVFWVYFCVSVLSSAAKLNLNALRFTSKYRVLPFLGKWFGTV